MGFFSGLKRAFGFSDNGEEHDDELDGVDGAAARSPFVNPFKTDADDGKPDEGTFAKAEAKAEPLSRQSAEVDEGIVPMSQHKAMKSEVQAGSPAKLPHADTKVPEALIHDIATVLSAHMGSLSAESSADAPVRDRLKQSENERRALQARYHTLSERVSALEGDIEHLEVEKKALQNKLKVAQVQHGTNADEDVQAQVESIAKEYKEKMELTNALLNDIRSEAARKAQEVDDLKEKLKEAQNAASGDNSCAVAELTDKLAQLEAQLAEQESLQAKDAKAHADALAEKTAEIDALNEKMTAKEQDMMDEMEGMLKEVEDFKQKKTNELAALKRSLDEANHVADEAKEKLLTAQNEKTKLGKQVADLNRRIADTAERHNQRDVNVANQIDQLKSRLKQAEKLIEERVDALDKASDTIAALEKERDAQAAENKTLHEEYSLLRKEFDGAKLVHEQVREENEDDKRQLRQQTRQLEDLGRSVEAKEAEIARLHQMLENAELSNEDAENELKSRYEGQITALKDKVAELKIENADLRQANGVLEQTVDSLSVHQSSSAVEPSLHTVDVSVDAFDAEPANVEQPTEEKKGIGEDNASARQSMEDANLQHEALAFEPAAEYDDAEGAPEDKDVENEIEDDREKNSGPEIDDLLDDIDWLVPSPPSKKVIREPEPEPEPERKIPDSRQMSLF